MKNQATKFDLHIHSYHSIDAFSPPGAIIKKAKRKNFGVAIADHNVIKGSLRACQSKEVIVVPAIETFSSEGAHALFYFKTAGELERFYQDDIVPQLHPHLLMKIDIVQLIKKARKRDCLIGWPHPYETRKGGCIKLIKKGFKEKELMDLVDFVETMNASASKKNNISAQKLAAKYNKTQTAGSDSHLLFEIGSVYTLIEANSVHDVLEAISQGKTKVGGKETKKIPKNMASVLKEGKTILRKDGHKILADQIRRTR